MTSETPDAMTQDRSADRSRGMPRHRLDSLSLLFGVVFALVGLAALAAPADVLARVDLRWVPPLIAVAIGVWVLSTVRRRSDAEAPSDPAADDPVG